MAEHFFTEEDHAELVKMVYVLMMLNIITDMHWWELYWKAIEYRSIKDRYDCIEEEE